MGEILSRSDVTNRGIGRRWWLITVIALAAMLLPTAPTHAQGTFGATPEPLTSADLELIADRLWMSESQILKMIEAHELYKAEFRRLREGKVQDLIDEVKKLRPEDNGMMPELPPRSELESLVKMHESICRRAKQLDENFFNVVQGQLSPEQAVEVPRVRRFRARQRCHDIVMMQFSRGSSMDFITTLEEMDMSSEARTAIEPILASYDVALTQRTEALYGSTIDLVMLMYDQIDASGLLDMDLMDMDPVKMMKAAAAVEMSWQNAKGEYQDDLDKLTKLNRRTHQQLASALPVDSRRELRRAYSRASYGRANPHGQLADRFLKRALQLDGLTTEQREAIDALVLAFDMVDARITEEMMDAIDNYRMTRKLIEMDGTDRNAMRERIDKLREERVASSDQHVEQLKTILGEELVAKLGEMESSEVAMGTVMLEGVTMGAATTVVAVEGELVEGEFVPAEVAPADAFIPEAISAADLRRYQILLGLTEDQMLVARTLHDDYREKYRTLTNTKIEAIQTQAKSVNWGANPPPTFETISTLYSQRETLRKELGGLDEAFFADLELTILEETQIEKMPAIKAARTRVALTAGKDDPKYSWGMGESIKIDIDILDLVSMLQPSDEMLAEAAAVVAKMDMDGLSTYRAFDEARLARAQKVDEVMVTILTGDDDRNWGLFQTVQPFQQALGDMRTEVAALQEAAVKEIAAKMDPALRIALEDEYYTKAYPEIYNDADSARDELRAALKLGDLSMVQKTRIEALANLYRDEYHKISRQIIEFAREGDVSPPDSDREAQDAFIDRQLAKTLLEFDREELSQSYLLRLRAILTEEQAVAVLGKPDRSVGFSFDFD